MIEGNICMIHSCSLSDYIAAVIPLLKTQNLNFEKDDKGLIINISSLYDYLNVIEAFEKEHKTDKQNIGNQFFYRGISDNSWNLEPSLSFNNLVSYESKMVQEFIQLRPDEFLNVKNDFDLLSKMQHYGLPTRLLDFSINPLVALFFACCDSTYHDKDGRIFMALQRTMLPSLRPYVEAPCSTYDDLEDELHKNDEFKFAYFGVIYEDYENLYFLKPNYITEREKRQEAVFLIFSNYLYDTSGDLITFEKGYNWLFGLTKDELCVDILGISHSIMPINNASFIKNFIRIDILKEHKPDILRQLELLGIKESFLFPELEYASKMLTEKYKSWNNLLDCNKFNDKYEI